jgi:hypothetical protein
VLEGTGGDSLWAQAVSDRTIAEGGDAPTVRVTSTVEPPGAAPARFIAKPMSVASINTHAATPSDARFRRICSHHFAAGHRQAQTLLIAPVTLAPCVGRTSW